MIADTVTRYASECCAKHDTFELHGRGWSAMLWLGQRDEPTGYVIGQWQGRTFDVTMEWYRGKPTWRASTGGINEYGPTLALAMGKLREMMR